MIDFELERCMFASRLQDLAESKRRLQARDLIDQQMEFARGFFEIDERYIEKIQKYTRSLGHPWDTSFVCYIINEGIGTTMNQCFSTEFPSILPICPTAKGLLEWAKEFATEEPYTGDLAITDTTSIVVTSSFKRKRLKLIQADLRKRIDGKMTNGIFEIERSYDDSYVFVSMERVYNKFIEDASKVSSKVVEDILQRMQT